MEVHPASELPGSPARAPRSPFWMQTAHHGVHLNMSQVIEATQNFSSLLKIGKSGFGDVYRAELEDGQVVAIKRAQKGLINSLQSEFRNEVELLTQINHTNLVRFLGYVEKGNEQVIITEHVPNGNLRAHLDGQHGKILDFLLRLEICIDVAHALTYLHFYAGNQIIHRHIKSSNILLTQSFRAKVTNFSFAIPIRSTSEGSDQMNIKNKVQGTIGYIDPEYLLTYQLTPKSDVYSFGILMTEILTSRRSVDNRRDVQERIMIEWAFNRYNDGNVVELLDPLMNEKVDVDILKKLFSLAFQCVAPTRGDRPNMEEVGEQLWIIRIDYLRSAGKI